MTCKRLYNAFTPLRIPSVPLWQGVHFSCFQWQIQIIVTTLDNRRNSEGIKVSHWAGIQLLRSISGIKWSEICWGSRRRRALSGVFVIKTARKEAPHGRTAKLFCEPVPRVRMSSWRGFLYWNGILQERKKSLAKHVNKDVMPHYCRVVKGLTHVSKLGSNV
jgi:hypothetical protein